MRKQVPREGGVRVWVHSTAHAGPGQDGGLGASFSEWRFWPSGLQRWVLGSDSRSDSDGS
jgi:hypothetical protein